ncbi:hypothetical protein KHC28_15370 [Ancylobacter sonchi]|uniref:hypothetical protein n=1 Tax=Ancylobacter sonchi TaxID=1937790 RepID=UPI001BD32F1B|nr:hypothetical protein [Ancylobacter sonchi]MBS7535033.1 hypothetical protein [Ancylobacter sonchi]
MTAIIALTQSHPTRAVHIATDSRGVDATGQRFSLAKSFPLPELSAALAVMGTSESLGALATAISMRAGNFADAVKALPDALRAVQAARAAAGERGSQLVVLVGFDDVTPRIIVCATASDAGLEPWVAHDVGTFHASPASTEAYKAMHLPADTDTIRMGDLPRIMGVMRNLVAEAHRHLIGGPVVLTSVYRDRIEQRPIGVVPEAVQRRGLLGRVMGL